VETLQKNSKDLPGGVGTLFTAKYQISVRKNNKHSMGCEPQLVENAYLCLLFFGGRFLPI